MRTNSLSKIEESKRLKKIKPDFDSVFQMFYSSLCFFATRLINDVQAAQDIVADVFEKYLAKQNEFESVYKAKAFLYISTRNACLNYNYRIKYQAAIKERIRINSNEIALPGLNETIYVDVLSGMYDLINRLPVKCREVMILRFLFGFDTDRISKQMKVSIHTVRNQITRGKTLIMENKDFRYLQERWESRHETNIRDVQESILNN